MERDVISIIMPVYNSEKYLKSSLSCIANQTYQNLEIFCIDDNSNDSSLEILNSMKRIDDRINIIHSDHKGAGLARNIGIERAKGKYICFFDSDDMFEPNLIEQLYYSAEKHNAEIVFAEYDNHMELGRQSVLTDILQKYMNEYTIHTRTLDELPVDIGIRWNITVPWNKMIRRDFIIKNEIRYQNIQCSNDTLFNVLSVFLANRIVHTDTFSPLIHYRRGYTDQISHTRTAWHSKEAFQTILYELKSRDKYGKTVSHLSKEILFAIVADINKNIVDDELTEDFVKYYVKNALEEFGEYGKECGEWIRFAYFEDESTKYRGMEPVLYKQIIECEEKKINLLKSFCEHNKVAIWGCGARGQAAVVALPERNVLISCVIDNKPRSDIWFGYKVSVFEDVVEDIDAVFVLSRNVFDDIYYQIRRNGSGIGVIPLFEFLENDNCEEITVV